MLGTPDICKASGAKYILSFSQGLYVHNENVGEDTMIRKRDSGNWNSSYVKCYVLSEIWCSG